MGVNKTGEKYRCNVCCGQITEKMGCSGELTYLRLCQLEKDGKATKLKAGRNILLWKQAL